MNNLSDNIHEGISISNEEILHPLQPLSKLEISTASAIVKNSLGENAEKYDIGNPERKMGFKKCYCTISSRWKICCTPKTETAWRHLEAWTSF